MVFVHPQAEWETRSQPINGPAPKGTPGTWVIHYPGSPSLFEPMTDIQMVSYLRNMQRDYVNSRGYSLGYSVIASQSGSLWRPEGSKAIQVFVSTILRRSLAAWWTATSTMCRGLSRSLLAGITLRLLPL